TSPSAFAVPLYETTVSFFKCRTSVPRHLDKSFPETKIFGTGYYRPKANRRWSKDEFSKYNFGGKKFSIRDGTLWGKVMVDRTNAAESVVTPSESIPPVRAVVRAIEILMSFTAETPELSLSELTRKVQMPKSTVYRLLLTLEQHKFIERTGQDRFRLGSALIVLGQLALNSRDLLQLALQPMQALRDRTGESVHLHILDANERLCIHTIQGTHDLRTVGGVGQRSPLHVGASAR